MISRRSTVLGLGAFAGLSALPACSNARNPTATATPAATHLKKSFALFQSAARDLVTSGQSVGVAVGMSTLGFRKSAYFGLADRATRTPVGPETQFRIASVTKPIVAASALQMEEEGHLSLGAKLADFFPAFPRAKEVTLTQLLQHTSGLANWWDRLPANAPVDFMNRPDALEWLAQMATPYLFKPGSLRSYSNSGFVVLGKVLERVGGEGLGRILSRYVLDRVGAGRTGFESVETQSNWATGYQSGWTGVEEAPLVPPPYAAGGLRSNLHDQLAFSDALFLGPLLEEGTKKRMFEHARVEDGRRVQDAMYVAPGAAPEPFPSDTSELGYGLGINTWVQLGERFYSHAGLIDGFNSYLVHAPRTGVSVSILSNTFRGTGELGEYARSLLRALD